MGGGPSIEQKQAAARDAVLSQTAADTSAKQNAREQDQYDQVKPFLMNRLHNGLDYLPLLTDAQGGLVARSFAPAYASLNKRFAADGLPSGSKDAAIRALDGDRARTFDSQLLSGLQANDAAKSDAASAFAGQQGLALNAALGNQNSAMSANNSIMQAPLQSQGLGGVIGGVVSSLGSAAIKKIPF